MTETPTDVAPVSARGPRTGPVRIAMWSGPRNISTAMMRAFENRPDTAVSDEPFYAAYLASTGLIHPQRDEILASQPRDWRAVVAEITGPVPGGRSVWYQKHMTHHMLRGVGRDWIDGFENAFLIRAPEPVLASYVARRTEVTLDDIGLPQQAELFDRVADRTGRAPAVIESRDVLGDPGHVLGALCARLGIDLDPHMLAWPAGRRDSDGVWGAVVVRRSRALDRLRAAAPRHRLRRPSRSVESGGRRRASLLRPAGPLQARLTGSAPRRESA